MLALLIEVTSIGIAGKALKKPIDIDRPGKKGNKAKRDHPDRVAARPEADGAAVAAPARRSGPEPVASERDAAFKRGIGVLASSARRKG